MKFKVEREYKINGVGRYLSNIKKAAKYMEQGGNTFYKYC